MSKKFISLLGITNYYECMYYLDNKKANQTNFVQEALVELLCEDWSNEDKIIVLLTEKAEIDNWYNVSDEKRRLKDNLINRFDIDVESKRIPEGRNIDEIWSIFDTIVNVLEDEDEVIFDITNSFRSIPMLALTVINYAKVVKNIKLNGIYYGAFERDEYIDGKREFPIIDLTSLDEILEWTNAVNSFVRYGNGEHIKSMSEEVLEKQRLVDGYEKVNEINNFIKSLSNFTNCIYTCRGRFIDNQRKKIINDRNSIPKAYNILETNIDKISKNETTSIKPIVPLVNKIRNNTSKFNSKDNLKIGLATIEWSINNKLIQQGYTAMEETLNTYICRSFDLNENDKEHRDEIVNKAINIIEKKIPKEKWNIENNDKRIFIENKIEEIKSKVDMRLIKLAGKLKVNRNDINHFGFPIGKSKEYDKLESELIEFRNDLMNILKENNMQLYEKVTKDI